ncbi:MAG: hypothetical protein IIA44_14300 [Acidobacteria bacterium]|nr:hypothetical protein [Acidobacteriota bacterium]
MNFDSTDMPVGGWTVWWFIFNNPSACSDGECGLNDALPPPGNPEVGVAVLWATGGIVGPDRMGHFSAHLGVGADAAPGQVLWGELTNPMGAEVQLIVKYHGPASFGDPALVDELSTSRGSCKTDSNPEGFPCYDAQVAIHLP